MYSILFSILLASTYVSAIPTPLGLKIDQKPDKDVEREREKALDATFSEANRQIGNMQEALKDPNDPRIKEAFGPTPNLPEISNVVNALATKNVIVQSLDPSLADNSKLLPDRRLPVANAFTLRKNGEAKYIALGSTFFSNTKEEQAGTIIHEATHYLAGTGDHHDTTDNRIIPADEPLPADGPPRRLNPFRRLKNSLRRVTNRLMNRPPPAVKPPAQRVVIHGGYADTPTVPGPAYEKMRDSVSNTYQNADSYRVFGSLCSRSLYKRGPGDDDSKLQCNLPPDYFEKKAAAKAAAAKGITAAAKKEATSPAATNGKAGTAKSTGVKGAKSLKGAATKAFRKGTSTRAKAGKGLKTVRGTKVVKGLKTTKGLKMVRPGKGLKAVKGTRAAKGLKIAKGAKNAKGLKRAKPGKGLKAVKGVKAGKGAKRVKASKAGKGVKFAKSIKAAKGAQRAEGKSSKAVKATKSTAARKTVSGAKTATRAAARTASHAAVKAVAPKAAVKVAAAIPKKGMNLRRDLGMNLDELE